MTTKASKVVTWIARVAVVVCASALGCASTPAPSTAANAPHPAQQTFASPDDAANALVQAAANWNVPALLAILGPDGEDLVASRDIVQDKKRAADFAEKASEKEEIRLDLRNPGHATLVVGEEDWPLPIPIVESGGRWHFDTLAGRDEILRRRIGANELDAITVCRGYVDAQKEYAATIHDNSGVNQYAQRIISTKGKHDGLAWQNPDGSWGGPVGEAVAKAIAQGYSRGEPYHGYYFKVLNGQGPSARLGELNYLVNGAMIGGFALVAWPAEYGVTGAKTFIVSYDGVVYQKDLGPDTTRIASRMELYDPDSSWKRTDDRW